MKTILVIDDDYAVRETISAVLSEHGFLVDTATNADVAIRKLREEAYDVALVDLMLGDELTGLDVLRQVLRKAPPPLPRIVLMTAHAPELVHGLLDFDPEVARVMFHGGRPTLILKPFSTADLVAAVTWAGQ